MEINYHEIIYDACPDESEIVGDAAISSMIREVQKNGFIAKYEVPKGGDSWVSLETIELVSAALVVIHSMLEIRKVRKEMESIKQEKSKDIEEVVNNILELLDDKPDRLSTDEYMNVIRKVVNVFQK